MGSTRAAAGKSYVGGKSGGSGAGTGTVQVSLDRQVAQDLLVALTNALGDGGGKTSKGLKSKGTTATKSTKTSASQGAKSAKSSKSAKK